MSLLSIKTALDTRMQAFAAPGMGQIAWQDQVYEPAQGQPYIAVRVAAYARRPLGVGADCVFEESGTYLITVNRPTAEGTARAAWLAEQIVAWFARGITLPTTDGEQLIMMNASEQPTQAAGNWITLPIVVSWLASIP
jgi:hypothetical protein